MFADTFTLPSFAKINLHLRVMGKRDDGFHELCTVFQTVSLKDNLTFADAERIVLTCSDKNIPLDEKNLIVKAAGLLSKKFGISKGASIYLEKKIPSPGGLGGGSSNAAVALIGLAELWKIKTTRAELMKIGDLLGSDVPFFFSGGTALGTGRGNKITEMAETTARPLLVVTPAVDVSTGDAFRQLNAPHLTKNHSKSILQICRSEAYRLDLQQTKLINDFENPIFNIEPEIRLVKDTLVNFGAEQALLSGSGASVFAFFENSASLQKAAEALKPRRDWRVFRARTISRAEYREALGLL